MKGSASVSPTLGLGGARALDPARYRIEASVPRAAIRPASRDELVEVVRAAARDGLAIVPWGGGVSLAHQAAPPRYDVALDLGALDRIVEHEPEDLTLTAECGVTLAALRRALAARGQELPLEGARAERATLGGVLAANASGARRLRLGAPRDRVLGARFVLGDGTLARSGGKVVKNVAGYGLHRLLCGARGGLGILVEASLKILPAPPRRTALVYTCEPGRVAERARWAFLPRLEPASVTVLGCACARAIGYPATDGTLLVVIGFEDDPAWVERQFEITETALGDPSSRRLDGEAVETLWQMLADLEEQDGARLSFATADSTPAAVAPLLDRPAAHRLVFHAPCGRLHLFPEAGEDARALTASLTERGFALLEARGGVGLAPAPQVAVDALRARIRDALDPAHVLAMGERV